MKKFLCLLVLLISFSSAECQKLKKLGIEFANTSYNFGDVQMWENQPAVFELSNKSKHSISILPLFSENDLEIIYPDKSIAPGESVVIKAIYYTSGTGSFSRKFPIYFSTSPEAYELKITGNIKSLSPTAYIQCPQAKPEHSKPKIELAGNVAELGTEIPLSGSVVKIVSISSKNNTTFYADKNGNFGSKMPTGNYEVIVDHPNYDTHRSFFFLGQNSGYLKIRLAPIEDEPALALNPIPVNTNQSNEELAKKEATLTNSNNRLTPSRVEVPAVDAIPPVNTLAEEEIEKLELQLAARNATKTPVQVELELEQARNDPETIEPIIAKATTNLSETKLNTDTLVSSSKPTEEITAVVQLPTTKLYTLRVIDEKTLEPLEDAQIYITAILDKKQSQRTKSDPQGMASFDLKKEDYKIIVNADNYISGEAKIKAGQSDEIIRIYLSPVSNLFEDIYNAKKQESDPDELLSQLSFGKTSFTFAEEEARKKMESVEEPALVAKPVEVTQAASEDVRPAQTVVAEELAQNPPNPVGNETSIPNKNKESLDSIQQLVMEMQEEREALALALAQAKNQLNEQGEIIALKEEEISNKETELNKSNKELEAVKTQFQENKELLAQKETVPAIAKESIPLETANPSNYELSKNEYAANNVLFLIDVSSSMGKENKMELLKESIKSMTMVLRDIDRVAIIAYNQKTTVVLQSVNGDKKDLILKAIDSLETSGLTYGVNGLQTAYELLQYYYIGDGNNQIILATDGLFSSANATMTENELNKEVRQQAADNGIKLSVIGFGQDEQGQKLMQKLASNGEGQFIQIKNPWEAKTVLVDEIKLNSRL